MKAKHRWLVIDHSYDSKYNDPSTPRCTSYATRTAARAECHTLTDLVDLGDDRNIEQALFERNVFVACWGRSGKPIRLDVSKWGGPY